MNTWRLMTALALLLSASELCSQFTLNGYRTDTIFIGADNIICFENTPVPITSISTPPHVRWSDAFCGFNLIATIPSEYFQVYLFSGKRLVDSITLSSHRIAYQTFITCGENAGESRIASGQYTQDQLLRMHSIQGQTNIPGVDVHVFKYRIRIRQGALVILDKTFDGGSLMQQEIFETLEILEGNEIIEITEIEAETRYGLTSMIFNNGFRFECL